MTSRMQPKATTLFWTQTLRMDKVDPRTIAEVDQLIKEITQEDIEQRFVSFFPPIQGLVKSKILNTNRLQFLK